MSKPLPELPENYRWVKVGEKILKGDKMYKHGKWYERLYSVNNTQTEFFRPTIRPLILKENVEKPNKKFGVFVPGEGQSWGSFKFLLALEDYGYYFYDFGEYMRDINSKISKVINDIENKIYPYIEINPSNIRSIINEKCLKKIYEDFGMIFEKIKISPEQKEQMINLLKSERAFNQDSALPVKDNFDIYYELAKEGEIGTYKDRFYVKEF